MWFQLSLRLFLFLMERKEYQMSYHFFMKNLTSIKIIGFITVNNVFFQMLKHEDTKMETGIPWIG